jgi:hypothetical protein
MGNHERDGAGDGCHPTHTINDPGISQNTEPTNYKQAHPQGLIYQSFRIECYHHLGIPLGPDTPH